MEDVIQVLIFLVIVTSVIISKYKEVNANRPGKHEPQPDEEKESSAPWKGLFDLEPEDEAENEAEELVETEKKVEAEIERKVEDKAKYKSAIETGHEVNLALNEHQKGHPTGSVKKPRIHLKTRREARKAFIYSEIFNRKYE